MKPETTTHLKRVGVAIDGDFFVEEFDADGVEAFFVEGVADVAVHQRALPHSAIAEQNHFQQSALVMTVAPRHCFFSFSDNYLFFCLKRAK